MHRYPLCRYASLILLLLTFCVGAIRLCGQTFADSAHPGEIAGEIREEESNLPVAHAIVSIDASTRSTSTAQDGTFHFRELPLGTYELTVMAEGYEPLHVDEIVVHDGKSTPLRLVMKLRSVLSRDFVHTADAHRQPIQEAPASILIVPSELIAQRDSRTLDQTLAYVPGVEMNGRQVNIRGASGFNFGSGSRVMLLVDGIPQLDPDDGQIDFGLVPVSIIQQIEVMKGPGSALYGSGAVNGVINIITLPIEEGTHGDVRLYGGLYGDPDQTKWAWWGTSTQGFEGIEARWTGKSNALAGAISSGYHRDDGYQQFDDVGRYNLFGKLNWAIDRSDELQFTAFSSNEDRGGYRVWRSFDSALYALTSGGKLARITNSNTTLNTEFHRSVSDKFSYIIRGLMRFTGMSDDRLTSDSQHQQSSAQSYLAETRFRSALTDRLMFMYGALLQFEEIDSKLYGGDHQKRTASIYAQMEFSNRDDITASVQGRVNAIDEPGTGLQETNLSPRIGLTYRPSDETAFRIVLGQGFRVPTIAERHGDGMIAGMPVTPNPRLTAEENWHGEGGMTQQVRWPELQLDINCALYIDEYFSLIEPVFNSSDGKVMFQNTTRANVLGADFQVQGIIPALSLSFTGDISTLSARDLKLNRDLGSRPSSTGHLRLSWQSGAFGVGLDYRYIARIEQIDTLLRQIIPDADSSYATNSVDMQFALDLFPLLDVAATVRLQAHNIFQNYALDGIGSIAPIRNFELGAEVKF